MNLLETLAKEFNISVVGGEHKVWFFRTKAGLFYHDFKVNNYIALGWDLLSPEFITGMQTSKEAKLRQIMALYPEEKRPGLILGQMETFYSKMQVGDLVVIPAEGGKEVTIGELGELQATVQHKHEAEEYPQCTYTHKRAVTWIKEVDVSRDIYLFKALRAQQTISDVSECSELIFRNLFPVYITEDGIHIMLQKETEADLNMSQNVELQYNLLAITDTIAALYGKESFREDITIKTAMGSPGFMELILPKLPISGAAIIFIINALIGKDISPDGTSTGISALLSKVNTLSNDHHNRKKTDAEAELIKAQAEKTRADVNLTNAQVDKTQAEAELIKVQTEQARAELAERKEKYEQVELTPSGKTTAQVEEENENLVLADEDEILSASEEIKKCSDRVRNAAASSGIAYSGTKIEKVS